MLKKYSPYRLFLIVIFSVLLLNNVVAQEEGVPESPLLTMLAMVPDTPVSRTGEVYFNDRVAIEQAYAGALMPASWTEFDAIRSADPDPDSAEFGHLVWWRVFMNTSSSQMSRYMMLGDAYPETVGFDFFDVERELFYGTPPATGLILNGSFNLDPIREAYSALGFVDSTTGDVEVWCSDAGCDTGNELNVEERNPANPFGGDLGRRQPMVIAEDYLMSSPSYNMVEDHIATLDGSRRSLAEVPEYVAGVEAISQYGPLIQAMVIDGSFLLAVREDDSIIAEMMSPTVTLETIQTLITERLKTHEDLPPYDLLMLGDTVTEEAHIGLVALVYDTVEAAERAAEILPQRIASYESIRFRQPLVDILEDRYIDGVETSIYESSNGDVVLLLEFATPRATLEEIVEITTLSVANDSDLEVTFPGAAYRLLFDALISRDTGWLSTVTRADLESLLEE